MPLPQRKSFLSLFKIIDSFPLGRRTLLVNWRVVLKKRVSQKHSVRRINRKILTNDFLLVIVTEFQRFVLLNSNVDIHKGSDPL